MQSMNFAQTHSLALVGLEPQPVVCEVDLSNQLPTLHLVGLPSNITQESKDRVNAAILNSNLDWPDRKITINLVPASLPKWGSHYELPMALGVLIAQYEIKPGFEIFAAGELSLSGKIRACGWFGHLSGWMNGHLKKLSIQTGKPCVLFLTPQDALALKNIEHEIVVLESLESSVEKLFKISNKTCALNPVKKENTPGPWNENPWKPDFSIMRTVVGEHLAVINALLAVAGRHHVLFAGPQGRGKSMLIKAIVQASFPMIPREQEERTALSSMLGSMMESGENHQKKTVFLQTSATRQALEGSLLNNGQIVPGELTRAHHGLLIADELLEFRRDAIECLRQPIEEGIVRLQRAKFRSTLPSEFQFLSSTNLCPCGTEGLSRIKCRCHVPAKRLYQRKLSGPILDRFDLISLVGSDSPVPLNFSESVCAVLGEMLCEKKWDERFFTLFDRLKTHEENGCHGIRAHDLAETNRDGMWIKFIEKWNPLHSKRVQIKILNVAKTLSVLMDEILAKEHVEIALNLRTDIEGELTGKHHKTHEAYHPQFEPIGIIH